PPHLPSLIHPTPATPFTLSLHDALPISPGDRTSHAPLVLTQISSQQKSQTFEETHAVDAVVVACSLLPVQESCHFDRSCSRFHRDRKSTRLNSSHQIISYAVFCLKKITS